MYASLEKVRKSEMGWEKEGCVSKSHTIEKKSTEKLVQYLLDKQTKKVSTFDIMNKSMRLVCMDGYIPTTTRPTNWVSRRRKK